MVMLKAAWLVANRIVSRPNRLKSRNLRLMPHKPEHLLALAESSAAYEERSGMRVADGVREFLLAASADFQKELQAATEPDPWKFGFAVVHNIDNMVIGMCGFAGPPDPTGEAEIAYSIAPDYQGRGYATEVAGTLIEYASGSGRVKCFYAYTLPQINASTRVLEKCGFKHVGEVIDSENNTVWRWQRSG
jgi:ribosomal-protein-alanine N-acetyltransferase